VLTTGIRSFKKAHKLV